MGEMDLRAYWDGVYQRHAATEVSWFQADPAVSMRLIDACALVPEDPLIDVGGGTSRLVDHLLLRGCRDVSVLDLSAAALEEARTRVRSQAAEVAWLEQDVLDWRPLKRYALWHDRAVFHFLTADEDRARYLAAARAAVRPGGWMIVATFARGGPERCSGLPVQRYDAAGLTKAFAAAFDPVDSVDETHVTPAGRDQHFVYLRLRRRDERAGAG